MVRHGNLGWVCPLSGMTRADVPCAQGHFCPTGSSNPIANRCPAGSYTDEFHTIQSSDCKVCPAGYACPLGTGGSQSPWVPCSLGHYCPGAPSPGNSTGFTLGTSSFVSTSSPTQFPCPAGTFGNNTRLRSASECTICPNGTFCNGGEAAPSGPCSAGHFCPEGSSVPNAPQNRVSLAFSNLSCVSLEHVFVVMLNIDEKIESESIRVRSNCDRSPWNGVGFILSLFLGFYNDLFSVDMVFHSWI